jgi:hypothetical protein
VSDGSQGTEVPTYPYRTNGGEQEPNETGPSLDPRLNYWALPAVRKSLDPSKMAPDGIFLRLRGRLSTFYCELTRDAGHQGFIELAPIALRNVAIVMAVDAGERALVGVLTEDPGD